MPWNELVPSINIPVPGQGHLQALPDACEAVRLGQSVFLQRGITAVDDVQPRDSRQDEREVSQVFLIVESLSIGPYLWRSLPPRTVQSREGGTESTRTRKTRSRQVGLPLQQKAQTTNPSDADPERRVSLPVLASSPPFDADSPHPEISRVHSHRCRRFRSTAAITNRTFFSQSSLRPTTEQINMTTDSAENVRGIPVRASSYGTVQYDSANAPLCRGFPHNHPLRSCMARSFDP